MPLTAVAMATSFSSSTESSAPRLPSSVAACARCASVTSGVAYQTVMPRPSWAGVLGMLRTIWRWLEDVGQRRVVAPAMMLISSWPSRSTGASSRPTLASICGLIPSTMTSASRTASTFDSTAWSRVPAQVLAALLARMAGDDLRGPDLLTLKQAGDHRLGHDAGPDGRNGAVAQ